MPEIRQMRRLIRDACEELLHARAWLTYYARNRDYPAIREATHQCEYWANEVTMRQQEFQRAFPKYDKPVTLPKGKTVTVVRGWDSLQAD